MRAKIIQVFRQDDSCPLPRQEIGAQPAQTPPEMAVLPPSSETNSRQVFALPSIFKADKRAVEYILPALDSQTQLDQVGLGDGRVQQVKINAVRRCRGGSSERWRIFDGEGQRATGRELFDPESKPARRERHLSNDLVGGGGQRLADLKERK